MLIPASIPENIYHAPIISAITLNPQEKMAAQRPKEREAMLEVPLAVNAVAICRVTTSTILAVLALEGMLIPPRIFPKA